MVLPYLVSVLCLASPSSIHAIHVNYALDVNYVNAYMYEINRAELAMINRLVSNRNQAVANHATYQAAMASGEGVISLIDVIPYILSWIVLRDPITGVWTFAPSKFIGYVDMTKEIYGSDHAEMDGRQTEKVLKRWISVIQESDADYDAVREALYEFCAQFGKKPNGRCRISILEDEGAAGNGAGEQRDAAVADLLVAVFKGLPSHRRQDVLRRLR